MVARTTPNFAVLLARTCREGPKFAKREHGAEGVRSRHDRPQTAHNRVILRYSRATSSTDGNTVFRVMTSAA